jgi:hypothetical protein
LFGHTGPATWWRCDRCDWRDQDLMEAVWKDLSTVIPPQARPVYRAEIYYGVRVLRRDPFLNLDCA